MGVYGVCSIPSAILQDSGTKEAHRWASEGPYPPPFYLDLLQVYTTAANSLSTLHLVDPYTSGSIFEAEPKELILGTRTDLMPLQKDRVFTQYQGNPLCTGMFHVFQ